MVAASAAVLPCHAVEGKIVRRGAFMQIITNQIQLVCLGLENPTKLRKTNWSHVENVMPENLAQSMSCAMRFRLRKEIFPLSSSSKSAKTCDIEQK